MVIRVIKVGGNVRVNDVGWFYSIKRRNSIIVCTYQGGFSVMKDNIWVQWVRSFSKYTKE